MNIVDTIILLGLFLGAATGFVRGFFKQTVIFLGTILVVVLASNKKSIVNNNVSKFTIF